MMFYKNASPPLELPSAAAGDPQSGPIELSAPYYDGAPQRDDPATGDSQSGLVPVLLPSVNDGSDESEPPAKKFRQSKDRYYCNVCYEVRKRNTFKTDHCHRGKNIRWFCSECGKNFCVTYRSTHIPKDHKEPSGKEFSIVEVCCMICHKVVIRDFYDEHFNEMHKMKAPSSPVQPDGRSPDTVNSCSSSFHDLSPMLVDPEPREQEPREPAAKEQAAEDQTAGLGQAPREPAPGLKRFNQSFDAQYRGNALPAATPEVTNIRNWSTIAEKPTTLLGYDLPPAPEPESDQVFALSSLDLI